MKIAAAGKGGVGKTTIAGTLARMLADEGQTVMAMDIERLAGSLLHHNLPSARDIA